MKYLLFFLLFFCAKLIFAQKDSSSIRIVVFDCEVEGDQVSVADGKIISSSIRTKLSQMALPTKVKILERDEMVNLFKDRHNAGKLSSVYDEKTATELGKIVEANYAVFGKVLSSKLFGIKISARLVDVEKGIIISAAEESYLNQSEYDLQIQKIAFQLLSSAYTGQQSKLTKDNKGVDKKREIVIDSQQVSKNCNYIFARSISIEKIISEFKFLISKIYACDEIPYVAERNAKTIFGINNSSIIISIIDIDFVNKGFGIVINEDGIYWQNASKGAVSQHSYTWKEFIKKSIGYDSVKDKIMITPFFYDGTYYDQYANDFSSNGLNINFFNLFKKIQQNVKEAISAEIKSQRELEISKDKKNSKKNQY